MHKRCHNTSREIPRSANGSHHHHTETQHKTCWSRTSVAPPNRYLKVFQPNHNTVTIMAVDLGYCTRVKWTLTWWGHCWAAGKVTHWLGCPPRWLHLWVEGVDAGSWAAACRAARPQLSGTLMLTSPQRQQKCRRTSRHSPPVHNRKKEFRERINTEKVQSLDRRNFFLMKMRTKNIYQQISSRDWDETMTS